MEKLDSQIIIGTKGDQACIHITPNMDASTAFRLAGTLTLHLLNSFYRVAESTVPEDEKDRDTILLGMKESMYDAVDSIISNVLNEFYPDAPRATIEDEAILELTNKKIEDRYNSLPEEAKKKFSRSYNMMKLKMMYNAKDSKRSK